MRSFFAGLTRSAMCRRNIIAGLAGLVLGSISGYALILWSNRNAPVIVHDEHEIEGDVSSSGHIDIYVGLDRLRDCPAETSRWLWTWVNHDGMRIKQFFPLFSSSIALTDVGRDQHFILTVPVPRGVWPGHWFYWSKTIEHCSLFPAMFRSPIRESADIPIRIIAETN